MKITKKELEKIVIDIVGMELRNAYILFVAIIAMIFVLVTVIASR